MSRIVIVDDNPICSRPLSLLLRSAGYAATCVDSGALALAAVRDQQPDLLVLDVQMPGVDGLTVLRQLRGNESGLATELPVIMYSATTDGQAEAEARRLGAQDYIVKGSDWDDMLVRIERHIAPDSRHRSARPLA